MIFEIQKVFNAALWQLTMYGECLNVSYLSYVCQYTVRVELLLLFLLAFSLLSFYELYGLVDVVVVLAVVVVVVGSVLAIRITVGETICDIWITLNIFMSHGCNNDLNTYWIYILHDYRNICSMFNVQGENVALWPTLKKSILCSS